MFHLGYFSVFGVDICMCMSVCFCLFLSIFHSTLYVCVCVCCFCCPERRNKVDIICSVVDVFTLPDINCSE